MHDVVNIHENVADRRINPRVEVFDTVDITPSGLLVDVGCIGREEVVSQRVVDVEGSAVCVKKMKIMQGENRTHIE